MNDESQQKRSFLRPAHVIIAVLLLVAIVMLGRFCSTAATIHVTVNGTPISLHGTKTMETAIRESGLPINSGDLISLQGNVLKRNAGYPFYATVNGEETVDPDFALHDGDEITVTDGKDQVEEYSAEVESEPHGAIVRGAGALCTITPGEDGLREYRTGERSGEQTEAIIQDPVSTEVNWYSVDVGDDKVIALTFEQGPSDDYTADILEILEKNEAHATFFVVGENVEQSPSLVQQEREAGHQVCTNTYDRAWTSSRGADALVEEVNRGKSAIANATGEDPSSLVRFPGADITEEMALALEGTVDQAVGWSLSTGDWLYADADSVYDVLLSAKPGDIVLMTDGGGDRSATVSALRRALPKLKRQGYSFITIDELMQYPRAEIG